MKEICDFKLKRFQPLWCVVRLGGIKSPEYTFICIVYVCKFFKKPVINITIPWIGCIGIADLNSIGNLVKGYKPEGRRSKESRAADIGLDGVFHLPDGPI